MRLPRFTNLADWRQASEFARDTIDALTSLLADVAGLTSTVEEVGVPAGGATGDALVKASGDDYDVEWTTPSGGSGLSHPQVMARAFGGS